MNDFTYRPIDDREKSLQPTFGVKFSRNVYIHPETANRLGIDFEDTDLEDTPLGKFLVIKNRMDNEE